MRVLASEIASLTPENAAGCQEMATSTSLNTPARAIKPLAAPPSSFFGGAAIVAHAAFDPARGEVILNRSRRQHGRRAEQVVAAAMAVTVAGQRLRFGDAGFLAQAGQRVIFAEDGDHRPVFARFTDHRSGDAGDVLRHPETLQFQ